MSGFRRKAVVVGINYTACGEIALRGCVNDAYAFTMTLVNLWQFSPQDILLLTDEHSDYESNKEALHPPYRSDVLQGLQWLTDDIHAGDVLVFYFAGHGLQLDNLAGWEGEGFDEAILPLDCTHRSGEVNAINSVCLRNYFLSVPDRVQLSIFLDCAGGQSALDVAGVNGWRFIKGVVQKGIWPLTDPTNKMHRAVYNSRVWTEAPMRAKQVRPRYVPGVEVCDVSELMDVKPPIRKGAGEKTHAYMLAGAPFSEVPVEGLLPSLIFRASNTRGQLSKSKLQAKTPLVFHGVYTWSLVSAMYELKCGCTYKELADCVRKFVAKLRTEHGLSYIDQLPSLTQYVASGSDSTRDKVFHPFGGRLAMVPYQSGTSTEMKYAFSKNLEVFSIKRSMLLSILSIDALLSMNTSRHKTVALTHHQM